MSGSAAPLQTTFPLLLPSADGSRVEGFLPSGHFVRVRGVRDLARASLHLDPALAAHLVRRRPHAADQIERNNSPTSHTPLARARRAALCCRAACDALRRSTSFAVSWCACSVAAARRAHRLL